MMREIKKKNLQFVQSKTRTILKQQDVKVENKKKETHKIKINKPIR